MSKNFYALSVSSIQRETPEAVTVSFEIPQDLQAAFAYQAGQYLTLKFQLNGQEVRRSYSMSSAPQDPQLAVTVKQVKKGLVSTHINTQLQVGAAVEVMPPDGRFVVNPDPDQRKSYYLIGAGSGITPLMSILRTLLEEEPQSTIHLLYGNRNEDSIIFKDQLAGLEQKYAGQLTVTHILSQPKREKGKGLGGWFSKGAVNWDGLTGRITTGVINRFLEDHPQHHKTAEYYLCGPAGLITTAEQALLARGVAAQHVHAEYFSTPETAGVSVVGVEGAMVRVHLNGKQHELTVPAKQTILDALLAQKIDPPYSCTSGACSSCMAKVISGSVKMEACYALDEEEVAKGYILTCQAHPTSAELEISYEV